MTRAPSTICMACAQIHRGTTTNLAARSTTVVSRFISDGIQTVSIG
ncbi:hypothetical protein BIFGAL_04336 [Bifidobacterium gallicum DSM 20093 = LMG 11596]|uniref:Uncharacterized protein n=1 Tax=Bifidobacterium gallicum DSM 20093 = LMG 11596 TaxID=561180 RepID=D1NWT0_9BIFI|nr:hypothetical protein BIFGAL_04336 [Bifidobacterium gallicum DSM 20093 = LMG 11596]